MPQTIISPSLLAADFGNLQRDCELVNESAADWFHIDVMDGVFVPNISYGMPVIEAIKKYATKPLDVHLMIVQPERYIETFRDVGAHIITVHYEACTHLHRTLNQIKESGCQAGVAINPATDVSVLKSVIQECDLVLVMSVNPGFGGQKFIEHTYTKVVELRKMIDERGLKTIIEIDGGVNFQTGKKLISSGANALVAGSFVFAAPNPKDKIAQLKSLS